MASSLKKGLRRRLRQAHGPLATPWHRFLAHIDRLGFDLGIVRAVHPNLHEIAEGVFRSAHPSPRLLRQLSRRGVRTIVNLRGADSGGAYRLESDAARTLGLHLIDLRLKSREIPDADTLAALRDIFQSAEKPLVFHCKSGADRAGLVAAYYLMLVEHRPAAEALAQLNWRYGHIRRGMPGILTTFLEAYRDEGEPQGLDLVTWRRDYCDPDAIRRRFKPAPIARLLTEKLLRRE